MTDLTRLLMVCALMPPLTVLQRYAVNYGYRGMSKQWARKEALRVGWIMAGIDIAFVISYLWIA